MLKWTIAITLLFLVLMRTPIAKKLCIGDLPGDFRIQFKRFKLHLPFTSTLLIGCILLVLSRILKF